MLSKEETKNIKEIKDMLDYASMCVHSNLQLDNKSSKLLYSFIEQLGKENKMFKDFYISCGNKDIADNITATKYCQIRESAYWEGYAQKQKEAIEICKQCKDRNKVKQLETNKQKIIEKLEERIQSVEKCYQDLIKPYYDEKLNLINTSIMSKKEKEEFINKRNCLLVQKHCYEEILEFAKGEKE